MRLLKRKYDDSRILIDERVGECIKKWTIRIENASKQI